MSLRDAQVWKYDVSMREDSGREERTQKKPWLLAEEASHGMNVGFPQNLRHISSSVNSRRALHVSPEVALLPPRKNADPGEVGVTHSHKRLINILSALR